MNKYIIPTLSVILALTACTKQDEQEPRYLTIKATTVPDTKSTASTTGQFAWSSGDRIQVMTTTGTFADFNLTSGAGSKDAEFTATQAGIAIEKVAVFGSYDTPVLAGKALTVSFPGFAVYTAGETGSLMVAQVDGDDPDALSFKHIGALLRVDYQNVPSNIVQARITSENYILNGSYTLEDYTDRDAAITWAFAQAEYEKGRRINISSPGKDLSLYFAIPTGVHYGDLTVGLYDNIAASTPVNGTAKTFNRQEFERGVLYTTTVTLPEEEEEVTFTYQADWVSGINYYSAAGNVVFNIDTDYKTYVVSETGYQNGFDGSVAEVAAMIVGNDTNYPVSNGFSYQAVPSWISGRFVAIAIEVSGGKATGRYVLKYFDK